MYRHAYKLTALMVMLILSFCVATTSVAQYRDSLLAVYNNQTIHTLGKVYVK